MYTIYYLNGKIKQFKLRRPSSAAMPWNSIMVDETFPKGDPNRISIRVPRSSGWYLVDEAIKFGNCAPEALLKATLLRGR